jgi:putative ABC transport system permease protein
MHIKAFHGKAGQPFPLIEVIGVVPDVVVDVSRSQPLAMYMSLPQTVLFSSRTLLVRPATSVTEAERETLGMLKAADPSLDPAPIATPLMTLDEKILSTMTPQRFGVVVLTALGSIALLLTILGTYVLAESMASARTREMGVRAALGATGRDLGSIVLVETARLVGVGLVAGLVLAWFEASTVKALLFRVEPLDPLTLAATAGVILTLALVVSLRPALAAARVDLARVLRDE